MKTCNFCKCQTEKVDKDKLCSNCSIQFMFQEIEETTEIYKNLYKDEKEE